VQYVFHTTSGSAFGKQTMPVDIICTFASQTNISCWVTPSGSTAAVDYVTGDPSSATTALASADGKVKVFAGLRGDPFHFNLCGFKDAIATVEANVGALTFDSSGCPTNVGTAGFTSVLLGELSETTSSNSCPSKTVADDFATADTLALVVSVDKSLVTGGGAFVSVWGATYAAP